jgi:hypothetical protein
LSSIAWISMSEQGPRSHLWQVLPYQYAAAFIGAALRAMNTVRQNSSLTSRAMSIRAFPANSLAPRQGMQASPQRMQDVDDGAHDRACLTVGHTRCMRRKPELRSTSATNREIRLPAMMSPFLVTHPLATPHNDRSFGDTSPVEALDVVTCRNAGGHRACGNADAVTALHRG